MYNYADSDENNEISDTNAFYAATDVDTKESTVANDLNPEYEELCSTILNISLYATYKTLDVHRKEDPLQVEDLGSIILVFDSKH